MEPEQILRTRMNKDMVKSVPMMPTTQVIIPSISFKENMIDIDYSKGTVRLEIMSSIFNPRGYGLFGAKPLLGVAGYSLVITDKNGRQLFAPRSLIVRQHKEVLVEMPLEKMPSTFIVEAMLINCFSMPIRIKGREVKAIATVNINQKKKSASLKRLEQEEAETMKYLQKEEISITNELKDLKALYEDISTDLDHISSMENKKFLIRQEMLNNGEQLKVKISSLKEKFGNYKNVKILEIIEADVAKILKDSKDLEPSLDSEQKSKIDTYETELIEHQKSLFALENNFKSALNGSSDDMSLLRRIENLISDLEKPGVDLSKRGSLVVKDMEDLIKELTNTATTLKLILNKLYAIHKSISELNSLLVSSAKPSGEPDLSHIINN